MLSVRPTRAFFRPGEPIGLVVESAQPFSGTLNVSIYHLADLHARWSVPMAATSATLQYDLPTEACRGYLVQVRAGDQTAITAFDVLDRWTQAPRYGFLYDFGPDRTQEDIGATLDHLLALHVNGLQFYDWQYRHDTLLPPDDEYADPLGRRLSLNTVRALIDSGHERRMAALPYTAIYAASPAFAAGHRGWQLYDAEGKPIDFAGGFLKIMNPGSGWRAHFIQECRRVLAALPFDGIHVDQYGEPRTGFDSNGTLVDLPHSFHGLLRALRMALGSKKSLLFNLVHNWPAEAVADVPLDFWYSELWPPDTTLTHLWRTVRANRELNARPVALAVYVRPDWEETVSAVHSTILAAGGAHIAHGDHGRYLSDPYFPKAGLPSLALAHRLKQLADFGVAYEEALTFAEDVTEQWFPRLKLDGMTCETGQVIVRAAGKRLFVNLLNTSGRWDTPLPAPKPLTNVRLAISGVQITNRWCASPEMPVATPLGDELLPAFSTWLLVAFELADSIA